MPGIITWERYAKVSANIYWAAIMFSLFLATDLLLYDSHMYLSHQLNTKLLILELLQLRSYKTHDLRSQF